MSKVGFGIAFQLRDYPLGQDLPELDAPLVKGIDVPDRALGEDVVLIEGYQLSEGGGRELLRKDRV